MIKKSCIPAFPPDSLGAKLLSTATLGAKLFTPVTIVGTVEVAEVTDGPTEGIHVGRYNGC